MDCHPHRISGNRIIKSLVVLIFVLSVFQAGSAYSQTTGNNYLSNFGFQAYYHNYEEPGVMEEKGPFIGISWNIAVERENYYGVEGLLAFGIVDYKSEESGSMDGVNDFCFEVRGIIGKLKGNNGFTRVIPYTGIAYRYLSDDSSNKLTTTGHVGYLREANYLYLPLGLKLSFDIGNKWSIQANAEYDLFLYGRQYSYTGYISGHDDIQNEQREGYGYRFSLGLINRAERNIYDLKVFFRYWEIEDSEVTTDSYGKSWIEPYNKTTEIGINAAVLF